MHWTLLELSQLVYGVQPTLLLATQTQQVGECVRRRRMLASAAKTSQKDFDKRCIQQFTLRGKVRP